jgi:hypothetical protein
MKKSVGLNTLLRTFRSMMPQDERFIERFCEHANLIAPAAAAFRAMMRYRLAAALTP